MTDLTKDEEKIIEAMAVAIAERRGYHFKRANHPSQPWTWVIYDHGGKEGYADGALIWESAADLYAAILNYNAWPWLHSNFRPQETPKYSVTTQDTGHTPNYIPTTICPKCSALSHTRQLDRHSMYCV